MDTSQGGEPAIGDAFGLALLDYLEHGSDGWDHFVERDDGLLELIDPGVYFGAESVWSATEAVVLERAGHRVLDIGAGAGRHALPLQQAGHDIVALDISPGAIEVCSRRDVRRTFTGTVFDLADTGGGPFDTFLLCGNNLGLLESPAHAGRFLGALHQLAAPGAEIIGTCVDPLATTNLLHLEYHELNRRRGRLPGQLRLRMRWTNLASPWFDYLFLPVPELEALVKESGWRLVEQRTGPRPYLAVPAAQVDTLGSGIKSRVFPTSDHPVWAMMRRPLNRTERHVSSALLGRYLLLARAGGSAAHLLSV